MKFWEWLGGLGVGEEADWYDDELVFPLISLEWKSGVVEEFHFYFPERDRSNNPIVNYYELLLHVPPETLASLREGTKVTGNFSSSTSPPQSGLEIFDAKRRPVCCLIDIVNGSIFVLQENFEKHRDAFMRYVLRSQEKSGVSYL